MKQWNYLNLAHLLSDSVQEPGQISMNGRTQPSSCDLGKVTGREKGRQLPFLFLTFVSSLPPLPPMPTQVFIICTNICSTFLRFTAGTKKASQNKVVLLYFSLMEHLGSKIA